MLTKAQRLTKSEFSTVFEHGKRIHSDAFTLIYSPTETVPKAAAVVPKKVVSGIVKRNLIKRRLYHILKDNFHTDTILLAKRGIAEKTYDELHAEYKNLLEKIK